MLKIEILIACSFLCFFCCLETLVSTHKRPLKTHVTLQLSMEMKVQNKQHVVATFHAKWNDPRITFSTSVWFFFSKINNMIAYCRNVPRNTHLCIIAKPFANPANLAHRQLYPFHEMQPIKSNFTFIAGECWINKWCNWSQPEPNWWKSNYPAIETTMTFTACVDDATVHSDVLYLSASLIPI